MFKSSVTSSVYNLGAGLDFGDVFDALHGWSKAYIGEPVDPGYSFYNKIYDPETKTLTIQLAFAGYKKEDIEVALDNSELTVKTPKGSSILPLGDDTKVTHRGISNKKHNLKFKLSEFAIVQSVKFDNGLLSINIVQEVPDKFKPKVFSID